MEAGREQDKFWGQKLQKVINVFVVLLVNSGLIHLISNHPLAPQNFNRHYNWN